jgi:hypothetical protein
MTEPQDQVMAVRQFTRHALAQVATRLAQSLIEQGLPQGDEALQEALAFALQQAQAMSLPGLGPDDIPADHPLARLAALSSGGSSRLSPHGLWLDLTLLASLSLAHEGFATLCRLLNPQGQPWPTVTLALQWLEHEARVSSDDPQTIRDAIDDLLCHAPLASLGLLRTEGSGPWHGQTLRVGEPVWSALMGRLPSAESGQWLMGYKQVPGLEAWLAQRDVQQALAVLRQGRPCQILVLGGDAAMRQTRVRALLGAAHTSAVMAPLDGSHTAGQANAASSNDGPTLPHALATAWLYRSCLWLQDRHDEALGEAAAATSTGTPALDQAWSALGGVLPVLISAAHERRCPSMDLPQIRLSVKALAPLARRSLWSSLLPQLGEHAGVLAARYPIEPDDAREVVRDLALHQSLHQHTLTPDEIGACVRARTAWHERPGINRVLPQADWSALRLPESTVEPLQAAVRRVMQQITVLDDWGFAQGRADRRGVRMLFHGAPGTGKTLAAEVMAHALGVDLLVVDLASLVSKYIGETEKNLSAVFAVAERSRALLLFDEADALFGKRTDTQDAHDRYANLETAYLLQRLERYEGVAVLTTNLRSQLDKAFTRRFEYIVEFPEPDAAVREALWQLHLPATAPLAPDVDLVELSDWYAISGAQIKNAALGAAFLAASSGQPIGQHHFLWAVEREYDKAGRAHPGYPRGQTDPIPQPDSVASPLGE